MLNTTARLRIFGIWGVAFALMLFMLELAPAFRKGIISPADAHAAVIKMAALFVPVLTAFATYWFRPGQDSVKHELVERQRWLVTASITIVYHLIVVGLLIHATYVESYAPGQDESIPAITFNEWVTNVLQLGLLLSPIATAPAAFLLGVEKIEVQLPKP